MAGLTFADVAAIGTELPDVTVGTWYGTPGLLVRGKGFCRMWSDREQRRDGVDGTEVLVVRCDVDEKPALIEASGGTLFSTPHYEGHGAMLVRLADVDPADLADHLEDGYRMTAPPTLVRRLDTAGG